METDKRRRKLGYLLLLLPMVLVGGIIVASFLQRPAPPGTQIVNKQLPEKHPPRPCYQCHEGMATGQAIRGKPVPAQHPTKECAQCHEGYAPDQGAPAKPTAGSGS
ncbi:MAG: hypothetical protein FJX75_14215 [Armatimonadetes bacterium]|nr:hypothetical protein [Armatimonadota bacterium]